MKNRRILCKTVFYRMLAHGSAVWCLHPIVHMARKISTIQRNFLLNISGAYSTTATAALQVILGKILLDHSNIVITWIKVHVGCEGNEVADSLANQET
ncbi:hypothetical protein AVEN_129848-1 [Araneus ventricosus]|uniref:Uncharacterized protein n=1 Tax=Araneus ventricosus TaxID=182803 RepID=A0A4Y2K7U9_ARAVE|nr:hypothetical protein AVEN_129848-1 [Araneus ventricosus]